MTPDALERHDLIRHRLVVDGTVRVVDLAEHLGVSEMTIRRDLDALVDEGVATRLRGGARAAGPQQFQARSTVNVRAKQRIADKLVTLLGVGGAIGLDASSTIQALAVRMGAARGITVLTNGPETFRALTEHHGIQPLLTGGALDAETGSLVGPLAARAASDFLLRRLFVGATGLDPDLGSSEASLHEAEVKLALARSAGEVVLAVDATKLSHRGAVRCLPIERVDVLVTDLDPADPRLDAYRERMSVL